MSKEEFLVENDETQGGAPSSSESDRLSIIPCWSRGYHSVDFSKKEPPKRWHNNYFPSNNINADSALTDNCIYHRRPSVEDGKSNGEFYNNENCTHDSYRYRYGVDFPMCGHSNNSHKERFRYQSQFSPRNNPSPTNHSVVTNVDTSSCHSSSGGSIIDHTYRDFSGVPPSKEDVERYNNKNIEYNRRINDKKGQDAIESASTNKVTGREATKCLVKKRGRGNKMGKVGKGAFVGFMGTNFPARLHDLLSLEDGINEIVEWLPHGRSWIVRDKNEFLRKVAPSHFQISKFESFTRQVNGWGFKRITQGPDINSYYHELFLKGMPHLIQWMKRSTSSASGGKRRLRGDPKDEPNFYEIGSMYPIPDYYHNSGGGQVSIANTIVAEVPSQNNIPPISNSTESIYGLQEQETSLFADDRHTGPQNHNDPWTYQPNKRHCGCHPNPPKRTNKSNSYHVHGNQDRAVNDFWDAPYNELHKDGLEHKKGSASSKIFTDKFSCKGLHTAASKEHWQSFCDALAHPEIEDSHLSIDRGESCFTNNSICSAEFEPHSIHDFNPINSPYRSCGVGERKK